MAVWAGSSWHGLEELVDMDTAEDMYRHGERCGAWPTEVLYQDLRTVTGLSAKDHQAIVGRYIDHPDRVLGVVGGRYRATTPAEWQSLVHAACKAGAKPTGAFSLRDGSRVCATFEVGAQNGLRTNLLLCDSFDGSLRLSCGFTTIRVVCANTLSIAFRESGGDMAKLRHTASLEEKVKALASGIETAIAGGQKVRETFHAAEAKRLDRDAAKAAFDALFPPAPEDASPAAKTRAENVRADARLAATLRINRIDDQPGNLATLWNAATYLVDRRADGKTRDVRGGDALDSLLFGSRAARIQEIQHTIEVILRDGSVERMTVAQANEAGIDPKQTGRILLEDMLDG